MNDELRSYSDYLSRVRDWEAQQERLRRLHEEAAEREHESEMRALTEEEFRARKEEFDRQDLRRRLKEEQGE